MGAESTYCVSGALRCCRTEPRSSIGFGRWDWKHGRPLSRMTMDGDAL